jgi:TonB family protein
MERLQKKCFVGSLASHGILIVVLAVGTAMGPQTFKSMKQEEQFVDIKLIDIQGLTDGPSQQGGGGGGGSPAPAPAPAPPPEPVRAPEPPRVEPVTPPPAIVETPKPPPIEAVVVPPQDTRTSLRPPENNKKKVPKDEPKREVKADAPTKKETPKSEPKKVEVKVNLAKVDRSKTTDAAAKQKAATSAAKARAEADAQAIRAARARQTAIKDAIDGLGEGLSRSGGGLDIASFGAGSGKGWGMGSGPTLMNYAQYVREIYDLNWIVTDAVVGDSGVVRVEIVVQRNGAARGKIVKSSGNKMLDRSVQSALDKVKNIGRPFPEGATDSSRTFTINFNLTSKRGTG